MKEKRQTTKELLTVNDIRFNNKVNILTNIVRAADITRNDLAQQNQISIMTVKHIVDELLEGKIIEEHMCKTAVGRKPMALNVSARFGNIVCINLTSIDEISYIIYDLKETMLYRDKLRFKNNKRPYQENLLHAMGKIKEALQKVQTQTVGIAVFVPSAYYEEQDLVNYDLIYDFKNLHIKKIFMEDFGIKNVLVIHDAFAAATSEYEGMDSSNDSQFYFYCGDGVGGFFIHKGVAVKGENLLAGEVGKLILSYDKGEDRVITLEERLAVPGIMKRVNEIYPEMEFEEALERYTRGDPALTLLMDETLDVTAQVLYNIIWIYNPTRIVVDSCYKEYSRLIRDRIQTFWQKFRDGAISVNVEVVEAQYDEYHMMRGCLKLVLENWIEEAVIISGETKS